METVDSADANWDGNEGVITTLMQPAASVDPKSTLQMGKDMSGDVTGLDVIPERTIVLVCGPPIMYKFVLMELSKLEIPNDNIYVSLERLMKCGVGKCGHCQMNSHYVCQEGAVFKYSDVFDVREAF